MERNYHLYNWETGEYEPCSERAYWAHKRHMEQFQQILKTPPNLGKITILSAMSDDSGGEDFKQFWIDNNQQ